MFDKDASKNVIKTYKYFFIFKPEEAKKFNILFYYQTVKILLKKYMLYLNSRFYSYYDKEHIKLC